MRKKQPLRETLRVANISIHLSKSNTPHAFHSLKEGMGRSNSIISLI